MFTWTKLNIVLAIAIHCYESMHSVIHTMTLYQCKISSNVLFIIIIIVHMNIQMRSQNLGLLTRLCLT